MIRSSSPDEFRKYSAEETVLCGDQAPVIYMRSKSPAEVRCQSMEGPDAMTIHRRPPAAMPVTRTLAHPEPVRPPVASLPRHRSIVALDIEQSTSRPDPVKAGLRSALYDLFSQALL